MTDSRKLAIKNLKGSDEEMRVSWMLKNMSQNKAFKYLLENEKLETKIFCSNHFKKDIKLTEVNGGVMLSLLIKNDLIGNKFNDSGIKPLCIDMRQLRYVI